MDESKKLDFTRLNSKYTRMLNNIAIDHKKEYTEFVDKYSKKYGDSYLWWATPFSSRNIYLDDTFLNICYLFMCQRIIYDDCEIEHIVLDNKALYETICINYAHELSYKKIVLEYRKKTESLTSLTIQFIYNFLLYVKKTFQIKSCAKKERYIFNASISLIDTPVLYSCIQNGEYQDRYFNDIQNYTKHDIYFVPALIGNSVMGWKQFASNLKKSKPYRFIFKEKYLHLTDFGGLFKYFIYCFILSTKKYKYGGIDVTPLIRDSLRRGSYCAPSLEGILNYQFIRRIKKANINVDNLISWYEGRPCEIMMQKAFRKYFPKADCVGYIGYPPTEFGLSQCISKEQVVQKTAPLKMTVPGSMYVQQAKQFCSWAEVIKVPILRNDYSYRAGTIIENVKKSILVILPYLEYIAENMLHILNEYLKENKDRFDIYIKNHPAHSDKKIDYYTKERIYFNSVYVEGDLIKCLQDVDIAFMSYSTAALEVLSQGKNLISLCPLGKLRFTGLPEGFSNDLCHFAYGKQEVFDALDTLSISEEKKIDISELLEPINEETINRMWE